MTEAVPNVGRRRAVLVADRRFPPCAAPQKLEAPDRHLQRQRAGIPAPVIKVNRHPVGAAAFVNQLQQKDGRLRIVVLGHRDRAPQGGGRRARPRRNR